MRNLYLHRRFFILLLTGIFFVILAFIFPGLYVWGVWFLWVVGILTVTDIGMLYAFGKAVAGERTVNDKFSNGEENPITVGGINYYPFRVKVRGVDEIPVEFQKRDLQLHFRLVPGEKKTQVYFLRPVRRGEYTFGQLRLFVSSPLSLVERRYSFEGGQKVAVYPSFVHLRKYELLALVGRQTGGGIPRVRVAGISTSFDQIKPYVQGDDPRAVNWKATAKANQLMVNAYVEERAQQVYCLIDKGRAMQAPFQGMTTLDYAINAALALAHVILKKGDKAGLLTFGNKPGTLIHADARRLQLNRICEALYSQQTHFLESDFEQLSATVSRQIHTRSLLILFTNFDTVSARKRRLPALRRLVRSHLVLLILFEDTDIKHVVREKARNTKEVYFKVLAGSFISEKRRIVQELRNAGIYTLLTEPGRLTVDVINSYLELKERGGI